MQSEEMLQPMSDTIDLLLNEARSSDDQTKVALILQSKQFLHELIIQTRPNSAHLQKTVSTIQEFILAVNAAIHVVLDSDTQTKEINTIMMDILNSKFVANLTHDVSNFIISLLLGDNSVKHNITYLYPMIRAFFAMPVFPAEFERSGGLKIGRAHV